MSALEDVQLAEQELRSRGPSQGSGKRTGVAFGCSMALFSELVPAARSCIWLLHASQKYHVRTTLNSLGNLFIDPLRGKNLDLELHYSALETPGTLLLAKTLGGTGWERPRQLGEGVTQSQRRAPSLHERGVGGLLGSLLSCLTDSSVYAARMPQGAESLETEGNVLSPTEFTGQVWSGQGLCP